MRYMRYGAPPTVSFDYTAKNGLQPHLEISILDGPYTAGYSWGSKGTRGGIFASYEFGLGPEGQLYAKVGIDYFFPSMSVCN